MSHNLTDLLRAADRDAFEARIAEALAYAEARIAADQGRP